MKSFPETDTWLFTRKQEKASWYYPIIPTEGLCFKNTLLAVETPKTGIFFELRVYMEIIYQLFLG